jgi:hypothetical protein
MYLFAVAFCFITGEISPKSEIKNHPSSSSVALFLINLHVRRGLCFFTGEISPRREIK